MVGDIVAYLKERKEKQREEDGLILEERLELARKVLRRKHP